MSGYVVAAVALIVGVALFTCTLLAAGTSQHAGFLHDGATMREHLDDYDEKERVECTRCGGDGFDECDDPEQCCDPICDGESCRCRACDGRGFDQVAW